MPFWNHVFVIDSETSKHERCIICNQNFNTIDGSIQCLHEAEYCIYHCHLKGVQK